MVYPDLNILGYAVALVLPWAAGTGLAHSLMRGTDNYSRLLAFGHGFLLGYLVLSGTLYLLDALGHRPDFTLTALVLLLCCLPLRDFFNPRGRRASYNQDKPSPAEKVLVLVLLLLLTLRYVTLCYEILGRPLFAWDAWMNWSPKALVWLNFDRFIEFAAPERWLENSTTLTYTLGNWQAWKYPETIPHIQLWMMLGGVTKNAPIIYIPWLFVPIALATSLFAHLRLEGVSRSLSLVACYILLSVPYINVHTALVGYADIWLAAAFGQACFLLIQWQRRGETSYLLLSLAMALLCVSLKLPGLILGLIVVYLAALSRLKCRGINSLTISLALLALAALTIFFGVGFTIAGLGTFTFNAHLIEIPYIGFYPLAYNPTWDVFAQVAMSLFNWSTFFYFWIPLAAVQVIKSPGILKAEDTVALILSTLFVVFTFNFTRRYLNALDMTSINRAILYLIPLAIYWLFRHGEANSASTPAYQTKATLISY